MPKFDTFDVTRFWLNVAISDADKCWLWKKKLDKGGYGNFKVQGATVRAHRAAYFLQYNTDPAENLVCHTCDTPACMNGKHFFLGTPADNSADMVSKNRQARMFAERHWSAKKPQLISRGAKVGGSKLTDEKVREICSAYASGNVSQQSLAEKFDVTREAISRIIQGKNWRHIANNFKNLSNPKRKGKSGEQNASAKLTIEEVQEIRRISGGKSQKELASIFGVSVHTISAIVRRKIWQNT